MLVLLFANLPWPRSSSMTFSFLLIKASHFSFVFTLHWQWPLTKDNRQPGQPLLPSLLLSWLWKQGQPPCSATNLPEDWCFAQGFPAPLGKIYPSPSYYPSMSLCSFGDAPSWNYSPVTIFSHRVVFWGVLGRLYFWFLFPAPLDWGCCTGSFYNIQTRAFSDYFYIN